MKRVLGLLLAGAFATHAEENGIEFFEKKIRPVLAESCYDCHGEKKQKGGLRLDTKAGWEKGGDTGPAIVPGAPGKSLVIQAVRYQDHDLQMPPEKSGGKMPEEKIAELEAWIKMGAPDPRVNAPAAPARDMAQAGTHWSFKPVVAPAVPAVKDTGWVKTPVDAFVLAGLEAKGLKPAPPAERRTLLRRVYEDLIGLPPSPGEMDAFLSDGSPDAFAKVVDRLLTSPHYGERWGRYWLDVARYADTRGYLGGGEERRFPFSFTYRDYVIRSFAEDLPYDRFLMEQIAADRLVSGDDQSSLAALGFLTLNRAGPANDIIDDRIDVVTRGLMALTVVCARCHDHKFDPIPTADYYSLSGVFQSSQEPDEKPLLTKAVHDGPEYQDYLKKKAEAEAKVQAKREEIVKGFMDKERLKLGDYLLAAHDAKALADKSKLETFASERKLALPILQRWIAFLEDPALRLDPVLGAWFTYEGLPESDFGAATLPAGTDPAVAAALASHPAALKDVAAAYDKLAGNEVTQRFFAGERAPFALPREELEKHLGRPINEGTAELRREASKLDWSHPGAPVRAMALVDRPQPVNPHILTRGNPGTPGAAVPRQFLELLSGPARKPFSEGSGRLELAKAIASRSNPLTARVFMNRVWGWHFGVPLVRTPGDFGVRTEAPVQLALLDWLSANFMENGWSLRKLHRQILLSSTYQQASDADPKADAVDSDNALLHRFPRHRLDFESMRDNVLASAGRLDLTVGGLPVEIAKEPFSTRRTVYGFIDRLNLPGVFRTFDFANPDISSPQRFSTTVPQQALFMLNSPFVIEQARALVHRPEVERSTSDEARLQALYALLFQRSPEPPEQQDAEAYLAKERIRAAQPGMDAGWQYGTGWYDPLVDRTKDFHAFAYSGKERRSPGEAIPDKEFGFVSLTKLGGHPGPNDHVASVLRWVSPADGTIRIEGTLGHASAEGDGVRGRIVSGGGGKLGEWIVKHDKVATNLDVPVKMGETIDFVVDPQTTDTSDSYTWAPRVRMLGDDLKLSKRSWDAEAEFAPTKKLTPLTAWETLAQALLVSNEMMFIE